MMPLAATLNAVRAETADSGNALMVRRAVRSIAVGDMPWNA